jgi:hypothetical protein
MVPTLLLSEFLNATTWNPNRIIPALVIETVMGYVFPGSYSLIPLFSRETDNLARPELATKSEWHPLLAQCFSLGAPVLADGAPPLIVPGRLPSPEDRFLYPTNKKVIAVISRKVIFFMLYEISTYTQRKEK